MQQALADPDGAPKATFGAATLDLEPLPLPEVTKLGHPQEDQARLETKFRELQAQVTPPYCPTTHPRAHSRLSKAPTPGPLCSLSCSATEKPYQAAFTTRQTYSTALVSTEGTR